MRHVARILTIGFLAFAATYLAGAMVSACVDVALERGWL